MTQSELEASFAFSWRLLRAEHPELPEPVAQYKGIKDREYQFDFAFPEQRVAIEVQGGTWAKGRKRGHTRGSMYERDCEKLALAASQGWRTFYLTTTMLSRDPMRWLGLIAKALKENE